MDAVLIGLWLVLDTLLVLTGKVVVRLASFGQWRGERLTQGEARTYGPAGALTFLRDGQRVVTGLGLTIVGALFYFALFVAWGALR